MSFASKPNRPDSKETAKLRKEYEDKARQFRDTTDAATKAKLRDDKNKAFARVVDQMTAERRENLSEVQKVLVRMGKLKTDEQMKDEQVRIEAARKQKLANETRV